MAAESQEGTYGWSKNSALVFLSDSGVTEQNSAICELINDHSLQAYFVDETIDPAAGHQFL